MDLEIREMKAQEADTIQKLGRRTFDGLEGLWVPKPKTALVGIIDGEIAGALIYKIIQTKSKIIGYLDYGFVAKKFHNMGIGGKLYAEGTKRLGELGCQNCFAEVKDDNIGSFGLLLKNDYKRASFLEVIKTIGLKAMLKSYFATPTYIACGMETYITPRTNVVYKEKNSTILQILLFLVINVIVGGFAYEKGINGGFFGALFIYYGGSILVGFIHTIFTKRSWQFRLNNGGLVISLIITAFLAPFPMNAGWYPKKYENTKECTRDLGVNALVKWLYTLVLASLALIVGCSAPVLISLCSISTIFLIYHILAFYPFESIGGKRVLSWNKTLFVVLCIVSALLVGTNLIVVM